MKNIISLFRNYKEHKILEQKIKELEEMANESRFDDILLAIETLNTTVSTLSGTVATLQSDVSKLKVAEPKAIETALGDITDMHNMMLSQRG
jgi:hypothetical protein